MTFIPLNGFYELVCYHETAHSLLAVLCVYQQQCVGVNTVHSYTLS